MQITQTETEEKERKNVIGYLKTWNNSNSFNEEGREKEHDRNYLKK